MRKIGEHVGGAAHAWLVECRRETSLACRRKTAAPREACEEAGRWDRNALQDRSDARRECAPPGTRRARPDGLTGDTRSSPAARCPAHGAGPRAIRWKPAHQRPWSALLLLEVLHVVYQRLDAVARHGIVDAGPHAAHRAMALEAAELPLAGPLQERRILLGARRPEADVHERAAILVRGAIVEAAVVEEVVEQR